MRDAGSLMTDGGVRAVAGAVRFVSRFSRETVNTTPTSYVGIARAAEAVVWPVKATAASSSGDPSAPVSGKFYVPDPTELTTGWRETDCLVKPMPDQSFKAGDTGMGKLTGFDEGAGLPVYTVVRPRPIDVDCGLLYDEEADTYSVDLDEIAGTGIEVVPAEGEGCDTLAVDETWLTTFIETTVGGGGGSVFAGCGLAFDGSVLNVDFGEVVTGPLAWDGTGCELSLVTGCGLDVRAEGLEGTETLVVDLTDCVGDGLTWDDEDCVLDLDLGCGLHVDAGDDDKLAVKLSDLAGDRSVSALLVEAAEEGCDHLKVDTDSETTVDESVVTDVAITRVGNHLRLGQTKVTYTNHYNAAGLHVSRTAGTPVTYYTYHRVCCDDDDCSYVGCEGEYFITGNGIAVGLAEVTPNAVWAKSTGGFVYTVTKTGDCEWSITRSPDGGTWEIVNWDGSGSTAFVPTNAAAEAVGELTVHCLVPNECETAYTVEQTYMLVQGLSGTWFYLGVALTGQEVCFNVETIVGGPGTNYNVSMYQGADCEEISQFAGVVARQVNDGDYSLCGLAPGDGGIWVYVVTDGFVADISWSIT